MGIRSDGSSNVIICYIRIVLGCVAYHAGCSKDFAVGHYSAVPMISSAWSRSSRGLMRAALNCIFLPSLCPSLKAVFTLATWFRFLELPNLILCVLNTWSSMS